MMIMLAVCIQGSAKIPLVSELELFAIRKDEGTLQSHQTTSHSQFGISLRLGLPHVSGHISGRVCSESNKFSLSRSKILQPFFLQQRCTEIHCRHQLAKC